jgi:hypothetical protein
LYVLKTGKHFVSGMYDAGLEIAYPKLFDEILAISALTKHATAVSAMSIEQDNRSKENIK